MIRKFAAYWIRCACAVIIWALAVNGFPQQYSFKNFPDVTGLQQGYIYSMSQDSLGYLWIGTDNGLLRYNGDVFRQYTTNDSLADNFVTCMIPDHRTMWFGHMNGSVSVFDGKGFRKFAGIPDSGPVTAADISFSGETWLSTYNGSFMCVNTKKGIKAIASFKQPHSVTSFAFTGQDSLLIGTTEGLYFCRIENADKIITIQKSAITEDFKIVQILKTISGKGFYIATENDGIYFLPVKGNNIEKINTGSFQAAGIQSISEDSNGAIWAGTFGYGLIRIQPSTGNLVRFITTDGLINENVKTVFTDKEGNTWCGNYGTGLTEIIPSVFSLHRFNENHIGNHVSAVCTAGLFTWIGTGNGLAQLDENYNVTKFISHSGKDSLSRITALLAHGPFIWIGTENKGVFRMDTISLLPVSLTIGNGELENSITSLAATKDFVWIGTKKGLCRYKSNGNNKKWFSISSGGLPHNSINSLYADSRDRLWISSRSNVLAYILDGKVYKVPVNTGNSGLSFGPFTEDESHHIWAGSLGKGIYRIDSDPMLNLNSTNGMLSDYCYALISDKNNHLWISHKGGLSRVNIQSYHVKAIKRIDKVFENINFAVNALSIDERNHLAAGSETGLLVCDLSYELKSPAPKPEVISIKINDQIYDPASKIVLNPGRYKITIEYQAISLSDPDGITYSTMLRGYDKAPEITHSKTVTYHNLNEGTYTFVLHAINGDGLISELPLEIRIDILIPVWKQWWFYLLLSVIIFLLVILYIKRREFRFRTEKALLEQKVIERTREIQQQKNELECQRDLISLKNAEITSSIRYAFEIQNAVLPEQATVDKYLPENFIYLKPKDIVSGDFYWVTKRNERIIFTVADCTGHGVPGAFMSVLSISTLNEIVNIEGITQSDQIVNKLHAMINRALNKGRMDGLDLALCVYDVRNRKLQYTGAMNNLLYFRNGVLNLLKADSCSVNMVRDDFKSFSAQEIDVFPGDVIYLHTDGYMDQFGGEKDKKYSIHRFYKTLSAIHTLPMHEQETKLDDDLCKWKKDRIQTDDITVMGIRF